MNSYFFYDTSSLILKYEDLFITEDAKNFFISSITLSELEEMKLSNSKNSEQKILAQKVLKKLNDNKNLFKVWIFQLNMLKPINEKDLILNNDTKILSCAIDCEKKECPDNLIFVTNDYSLSVLANLFFGEDSIQSVIKKEPPEYKGFKEISLSFDELNDFYSGPYSSNQNCYNLLINEYLIIRESVSNEIQDIFIWSNNTYQRIFYGDFNSKQFGQVKALPGDCYQHLFMDSLIRNKITMVKGPAGSGKTFLSLGFLFYCLELHKIDKIIIFCNTIATKNSAKLGFYPGTRDEKLLDSQIGNLLSSKIGARAGVEQLISQGQIVLLPLSDIRGYDTTGMKAGVYISEAQNMDISLMKLALQRIGEDCYCIIDGDFNAQVDDESFSGKNNGMRAVSKVFRNHDIYGEISLQKIHRSEIARIAEQL